MKYLVSIIVPIYNSEKYLKRCVDSLIAQNYSNIEIILIDDGSKDKSLEILQEYSDDRVNILSKVNSGVSDTRNLGIKIAKGEYIVFVDSDDFVEENYVQCLIENIEKGMLVFGGLRKVSENTEGNNLNLIDEFNNLSFNKKVEYMIIKEVLNSPCNKIYLRSTLIENNIVFNKNIKIGEDLLFNFTYLNFIDSIKFTNQYTYNCSIDNEQSLSREIRIDKFNDLVFVINLLCKLDKIGVKDSLLYIKKKNICSTYKNLIYFTGELKYNQLVKYIEEINIKFKIDNISGFKLRIIDLCIFGIKYINKYILASIIYSIMRIK